MIEYLKVWIDSDGSRLPWVLVLVTIAWLVLAYSSDLDRWINSRRKK